MMNAGATRDRIIAATLQLIADQGLGGVTMKEIAAASAISRQTLYNHFPDVDTIVAESLEAHQQATLDELRAILAAIAAPEERLEHLVRHSGAVGVHHHPVVVLGRALSAEARASLDRYEGDLLAIVEDTLRDGVEAGAFRPDVDVVRDARLVVHMLDATADLAAGDPEHVHEIVATASRTVHAAVGRAA